MVALRGRRPAGGTVHQRAELWTRLGQYPRRQTRFSCTLASAENKDPVGRQGYKRDRWKGGKTQAKQKQEEMRRQEEKKSRVSCLIPPLAHITYLLLAPQMLPSHSPNHPGFDDVLFSDKASASLSPFLTFIHSSPFSLLHSLIPFFHALISPSATRSLPLDFSQWGPPLLVLIDLFSAPSASLVS